MWELIYSNSDVKYFCCKQTACYQLCFLSIKSCASAQMLHYFGGGATNAGISMQEVWTHWKSIKLNFQLVFVRVLSYRFIAYSTCAPFKKSSTIWAAILYLKLLLTEAAHYNRLTHLFPCIASCWPPYMFHCTYLHTFFLCWKNTHSTRSRSHLFAQVFSFYFIHRLMNTVRDK